MNDYLQRRIVGQDIRKKRIAVGVEQLRVKDDQIHHGRIADRVVGIHAAFDTEHRIPLFFQLTFQEISDVGVNVGDHDVE